MERYGDFIELDEDRDGEGLALRFSPSSTPLQQRWRNNGLSADFVAGYISTFLPVDDDDPSAVRRRADVPAAVGYVANELLENAMKYGDGVAGRPIVMHLRLEKERVIFQLSNGATSAQADALRAFIRRLEAVGPDELMIAQMEDGGGENGSGLGLATMMNDYGAKLAFQLVGCKNGEDGVITTQVELDM